MATHWILEEQPVWDLQETARPLAACRVADEEAGRRPSSACMAARSSASLSSPVSRTRPAGSDSSSSSSPSTSAACSICRGHDRLLSSSTPSRLSACACTALEASSISAPSPAYLRWTRPTGASRPARHMVSMMQGSMRLSVELAKTNIICICTDTNMPLGHCWSPATRLIQLWA